MTESLPQIEETYVEKVRETLENQLPDLQNPQHVFFGSWTFTNPEGRIARVWRNNEGRLETDKAKETVTRIWSFIFPETREDYLIERVWNSMPRPDEEEFSFKSLYFYNRAISPRRKKVDGEALIRKDFIKNLKGGELARKIETKSGAVPAEHQGVDKDLKVARILKYDGSFNQTQIDGIDVGFYRWVAHVDEHTRASLDSLFQELYKDDVYEDLYAARHAPQARKFLTMWQNFSVTFLPELSHVLLSFYVSETNPNYRHALGLFYGGYIKAGNEQIKKKTKDIIRDKIALPFAQYEREIKGTKIIKKPREVLYWEETLAKEKNKELWLKTVKKADVGDSLNNLMELTGRLAFSAHEARPLKFAFIAGTYQVWPAIEEIISLKFYDEEVWTLDRSDIGLLADLCEANYSLFQIEGVVGSYYVKDRYLNRIVRLHYPSKEELRTLEDPLCDLDDLFCWSLKKIYDGTKGAERSFMVFAQGNGKVLIYGLTEQDKGDLLLVWDVRKREVCKPISDEKIAKIQEKICPLIEIGVDSQEFTKLIKAIRKISASPGDGACLVVADDRKKMDKYLATIEILRPSWLKTLTLDDPQYVLKATFVMDGACLITAEGGIKPRLTAYPWTKGEAWGVLKNLNGKHKNKIPFSDGDLKRVRKLIGKGSKTHASANLTTIPDADCKIVVISISADGPVKIWPNELPVDE